MRTKHGSRRHGASRRGWERHRLSFESLEERRLLAGAGLEDFAAGEVSVARLWNEALLDAIRIDTPRPTVHARNLWHTSLAMYDAWAAYDSAAQPHLHQEAAFAADPPAARNEAVSYAAYRVLTERFENSPGAIDSLAAFDSLMVGLGYDPAVETTAGNTPAALGNRVAESVLAFGLTDGANEAANYADTSGYTPVNDPLDVASGAIDMDDPNHWQPLMINGAAQQFLTPHWGDVAPFALTRDSADEIYHDPGLPPQLGGAEDAEFKEAVLRVIRYSSQLDPADGEQINISPAVLGDNTLGHNDGDGHELNPDTGEPYDPNVVNQADWGRVLAEYWADGPDSETPPGHWNVLANHVSDRLDELKIAKRLGGEGPVLGELEWDAKLYFGLNAAMHDAAIAAWDSKEAYDYVRPISAVRHMGSLGQSSDPGLPSYHEKGLPLEPGLVELITAQSTAAGERHEHLAGGEGKIAIRAWRGHPSDASGVGGVGWILAEEWLPYQAEDFVTPAFAGFVSGHSTFSRAAAEVLTHLTGDSYFPGGLAEFTAEANDYLSFENGPSNDTTLQWATYYDAADEAGLSRIYGGIHVDADDYDGRVIGSHVGIEAFEKSSELFAGERKLVIIAPAGDGRDAFTLRREGDDLLVVHSATGETTRRALALVDAATIVGAAGEPLEITVDFASGGSFDLPGGLRIEPQVTGQFELLVRGTADDEEFEFHGAAANLDGLEVLTPGLTRLMVDAASGDDSLAIARIADLDRIDLAGGPGDDVYALPGAGAFIALRDIGGVDTLDFSGADGPVSAYLGRTHGWARFAHVRPGGVQLHGVFENAIGTPYRDRIVGGPGANHLQGGAGDDLLVGLQGDDVLQGGDGRDVLFGGAGDDLLDGGEGDDRLFPGRGDDELAEPRRNLLPLAWVYFEPNSLVSPFEHRYSLIRRRT